ncbi:DNA repair and recombination protein rad52 [Entamoeba marina]
MLPTQPKFGLTEFSNTGDIEKQLSKKTPIEYISSREDKDKGITLRYLEAWKVVTMANNIFGDDGWSSFIKKINIDSVEYNNYEYEVTSTATVQCQLKNGVSHEDVGIATVFDRKKSVAISKSKKEAVTDGIKRTLRLFGNFLGNSLEGDTQGQQTTKKEEITKPKKNATTIKLPTKFK